MALPWVVLDSAAYQRLSHPAKALLMEIARQYVRDNNGRLLCSHAYLKPRGWGSRDVITRAKRELLAAGLIFETCKGARPNKASWYAVTWYTLDKHTGYDPEAADFRRGAFMDAKQILSPSHGTRKPRIVPSPGTRGDSVVPSPGPIEASLPMSPVPSPGHHLDMPSVGTVRAQGLNGKKTPGGPIRHADGLH